MLRAGAEVFTGFGLPDGGAETLGDVEVDGAGVDGRGARVGTGVAFGVGEGVGRGVRVGVAWAAVSSGIPNLDAFEAPNPPNASATARVAPPTTRRLTSSVRLRRQVSASLRRKSTADFGFVAGADVGVADGAEVGVAAGAGATLTIELSFAPAVVVGAGGSAAARDPLDFFLAGTALTSVESVTTADFFGRGGSNAHRGRSLPAVETSSVGVSAPKTRSRP
jgi:hypothetical protein